jgi:ATP-dependent Lhr-like helicase
LAWRAAGDEALLALEVGRRGAARPLHVGGDGDTEWCDRALLARIHRYTLSRLRAEIEPVTPADFMRFLFKWQHVGCESRGSTGPDGLKQVLERLDGFEARHAPGTVDPAGAPRGLRAVAARHGVPVWRGALGQRFGAGRAADHVGDADRARASEHADAWFCRGRSSGPP